MANIRFFQKALLAAVLILGQADASEFPRVQVTSVRRVFYNGRAQCLHRLDSLAGGVLAVLPKLPGRTYGAPDCIDLDPLQQGHKKMDAGSPFQRPKT